MFTSRMLIATRFLALNRHRGWMSTKALVNIHGIKRATLRALLRRGVVVRHWNFPPAKKTGELWRLSPLARAILEAGRA